MRGWAGLWGSNTAPGLANCGAAKVTDSEEPMWRRGVWRGNGEACRDGTNTQTLVIPLPLVIFTESLWYPPLLDPVRGDSREVSFKR